MKLFNDISTQEFIDQYWQQESFVSRQSLTDLNRIIDGNHLAGLACEDEVESRIISGHDIDGDWLCQHGPFTEKHFAHLSESDWTLLVQNIDQHESNLRDILNRFDFLPNWRLESIMASYAANGGGVGPHFDYYDVFIIQVSGRREWKLGQTCNEQSILQQNDQIKLLSTFECKDKHILEAGDMIYIPAGRAHWGTAISDDCISLSIGFRAPSEKDLIAETLSTLITQFDNNNNFSDSIRYRDTTNSIDSHPNKINATAQEYAVGLINGLDVELIKLNAIQAFGQLVTESSYECLDDDLSTWLIDDLIHICNKQESIKLSLSINSRFAFIEKQLFINGQSYNVGERFSRSVCDKSIEHKMTKDEMNVLLELLNLGLVTIEP